jgi:transcriptional regulator with XRE-family HTH domain
MEVWVARRSSGSQLARRRLGTSLRRLREQANIRIDAAAKELECSTAKISRLENGLGPAKLWDVRILLNLYGVSDEETREQFEQWARDSKAVGWWESDADLTTDDFSRYLAAETEAARLRIYCSLQLPSQLQIPSYARAHIAALHPDWSEGDVRRFANLRTARQAALLEVGDPLRIEAIVDEGAVRRRVGTRQVHVEQLAWLTSTLDEFEKSNRTDLQFQILPFSAGPCRAIGSFTIFDPQNPALDPQLAHSEDASGASWAEGKEVERFAEVFAEAAALALDPVRSRRLLHEVIESL